MMLHPYFSQYRALMLAERKRRARARLLHISATLGGMVVGGVLIGMGWPW